MPDPCFLIEFYIQFDKSQNFATPALYECFWTWWYPQIIHSNRVFHYKPSILGYPYFWKHPYTSICNINLEGFLMFLNQKKLHCCWISTNITEWMDNLPRKMMPKFSVHLSRFFCLKLRCLRCLYLFEGKLIDLQKCEIFRCGANFGNSQQKNSPFFGTKIHVSPPKPKVQSGQFRMIKHMGRLPGGFPTIELTAISPAVGLAALF